MKKRYVQQAVIDKSPPSSILVFGEIKPPSGAASVIVALAIAWRAGHEPRLDGG